MILYTCGFLMTMRLDKVTLIKKVRPKWQEGYWNGIGGGLWDNEYPHVGMQRELNEEAGVYVPLKRIHCFQIDQLLQLPKSTQQETVIVYYFVILGDECYKVVTRTAEEVKVFDLLDFEWDANIKLVYNIKPLLQTISAHAHFGTLFNLDPQGVNSTCPL